MERRGEINESRRTIKSHKRDRPKSKFEESQGRRRLVGAVDRVENADYVVMDQGRRDEIQALIHGSLEVYPKKRFPLV